MARHNFLLSRAGGWLQPLSAKPRQEIAQRWPAVPLEAIEREFGYYLIRRDLAKGQPAAREIKQEAKAFQKRIDDLLESAETISKNNIGSIINQKAGLLGHPKALRNLIDALQVLHLILPRAIHLLPNGHAINPRHVLVAGVAPIIVQASLPADARPKGPLCQIVGILLEAAGEESPSSVVEIVKPVVRALKKNGGI